MLKRMLFCVSLLLLWQDAQSKPLFDSVSYPVNVRGVLLCNGQAMAGTRVFLYDEDRFVDELIGLTHVDNTGLFKIKGNARESDGKIDPVMMFHHKCDVHIKPKFLCDLRTTINIYKELDTKPIADLGMIEMLDYKQATVEHCSWVRWFIPEFLL